MGSHSVKGLLLFCIAFFFIFATYLTYDREIISDLNERKSTKLQVPNRKRQSVSAVTDDRRLQWVRVIKQSFHTRATKRLPDVIGIGVKKCGTGALIHFLAQHPLVEIADKVETMFFSSNDYQRGLRFYKGLMPVAHRHQLIAEKSPTYFHSSKAAGRIMKSLPKAKLILSLCNPINRAFSDFMHTYRHLRSRNGAEIADLFHNEAIRFLNMFSNSTGNIDAYAGGQLCNEGDRCQIFAEGIYYPHVLKWRRTFNASRLLVVDGEKWITNPGELLEKEQYFLNLPVLITRDDFVTHPQSGFYCINEWWSTFYQKRTKTTGETVVKLDDGTTLFCLGRNKGNTRNGVLFMHEKTRRLLREFYAPYNRRLFEILDRSYEW